MSSTRNAELSMVTYLLMFVFSLFLLRIALAHSTGVVFAGLLTRTPDNQRGGYITDVDGYTGTFLNSTAALNLAAVVVHDDLPTSFVQRAMSHVRFWRTGRKLFDGASDRYLHYYELLHNWPGAEFALPEPSYIVFADFDVFFQHDPFAFMNRHGSSDLFLSRDKGTEDTNWWMVENMRSCGQRPTVGRAIDNAGYWGGKRAAVVLILHCMHAVLSGLYSGVGCDMTAFNVCVRRLEPQLSVYRGGEWSNPMWLECQNKTYVGIHNKCHQ